MRVSIILPSLEPGGAEIHSIELIRGLIQNHHVSIQLIILTDNVELLPKLANLPVALNVLNYPELELINKKAITRCLLVKGKVSQIIDDFDAVHVIAILPTSHFLLRLLRFKKDRQRWMYYRSTDYEINRPNTLLKKLFEAVNKAIRSKKENSIFISQAVKKDIESHFPVNRGFIIYNGISQNYPDHTEVIDTISTLHLQLDNYIIVPGRIDAVKGHEKFLEQAGLLFLNNRFKLVFAGYGPLESEIKAKVISMGLQKLVVFTGKIKNNTMLSLVQGARAVVIPSLGEGLGNVAIESLMLGKTIIATRVGGLPEIIKEGKTGYLYDPDDAQRLNYLLQTAIQSMDKIRMNEQNLKDFFLQNFEINNQVSKTFELLNQY